MFRFGMSPLPYVAPTLPQATVDTTYSLPSGTTHTPANSAAFATALTNAALNDVIVLTAGVTYTGPFTLPNKVSGSGWIYIISSDLASLAAGTRVATADATHMPLVRSTTNNSPAIGTATAAHHFRFAGIEIANAATTQQQGIAEIGNGESSSADLPHHIIFDRCYIHGDATNGGRRGISMNGNNIAATECYISDFFEDGADSQAIFGYNGEGPFKIYNSYLEAGSENVMFGGTDPQITDLIPSDITIQRNTFSKPLSWIGTAKQIKNLFELKNARRVLLSGNLMENCWTGSQQGSAIVITPRNANNTAPWCTTDDLTIQYNKIVNVGQGIEVSGTDDAFTSAVANRILITQNLISVDDVVSEFVRILHFTNPATGAAAGPTNLTVIHNTGIIIPVSGGHSCFSAMGGTKADALWFKDNLLATGTNGGFLGNGTTEGTNTLSGHYTNGTLTNDAWFFTTGGSYPAGNFFPVSIAAVKFVDYAGGNYRLAADSDYHAGNVSDASDGTDLGADIDAILAAIG